MSIKCKAYKVVFPGGKVEFTTHLWMQGLLKFPDNGVPDEGDLPDGTTWTRIPGGMTLKELAEATIEARNDFTTTNSGPIAQWIRAYSYETDELLEEHLLCEYPDGVDFWFDGCLPISRTVAQALLCKKLPAKCEFFLEFEGLVKKEA